MGRRQLLPVLQKATQALASSWSVSIAQYNILGGYLAKPKYFPYCQPHLLEWDNRKERIFSEITEHQVCCAWAFHCHSFSSCYGCIYTIDVPLLSSQRCVCVCVCVANGGKYGYFILSSLQMSLAFDFVCDWWLCDHLEAVKSQTYSSL